MQAVPIETLIHEIDAAITRLKDAAVIDQKKELTENIYPLLRMQTLTFTALISGVAEQCDVNLIAFGERLEEVDSAIAEYITAQESVILPDLASRIQAVFALADSFCDAVSTSDKWKGGGIPKQLASMIEMLRSEVFSARKAVDSVTIEEEDNKEDSGASQSQS